MRRFDGKPDPGNAGGGKTFINVFLRVVSKEEFLMEKTWLFIKGHLALIIAIAVGLLSYICFGGAAFSYEDEAENEVLLSFVDTRLCALVDWMSALRR